MTKVCTKCKKEKLKSEFYSNGKKRGMCKLCENICQRNSLNYKAYQKSYQKRNRKKLSAYLRKYNKKRNREDINFKLKSNLRNRLNQAIRKNAKSGSAVNELGCSINDLKIFLEGKFEIGMSWNNWGRGDDKWHIDHITPISWYNLKDPLEFALAVHYTNLQPLWAKDNLRKHNTL
jgi:hypothetical protein